MLKVSYEGCLGLSLAISVQFALKMCVAVKITKNSRKPLILEVQSRSRSAMLIKLKSPWPVLVMISNTSVPICNRFHTIRANTDKITSFRGDTPLWCPRSRWTSAPSGTKFRHNELESLRQLQWRFRDPSLHHFDRAQECDRHTDRWTDAQAMAKMHEAFCYHAQKLSVAICRCFKHSKMSSTIADRVR